MESPELGFFARNLAPTGRLMAALYALLVVGLIVIFCGAWILIQRDRRALVERFEGERQANVLDMAQRLAGDVQNVSEDLGFAVQLAKSAADDDARRSLLTALLGSVRAYRAAEVYAGDEAAPLVVVDPRLDRPLPEGLRESMAETAALAMNGDDGAVETSRPSETEPLRWFRSFGTAFTLGSPEQPTRRVAVVLLVDMSIVLSSLRLLQSDPHLKLLLLGPYGTPVPVSDEKLSSLIGADGSSSLTGLGTVVAAMRSNADGVVHLGARDAAAIGMPSADVVIAFTQVPMVGGLPWSIATFTSTAALRSNERAIVWRLGLASSAVALALVIFDLVILFALRRTVTLRERLRHAGELAQLHELADKVLESIPSGVLVLSASGRVALSNRALRDRATDTAAGATLREVFPEASAEALDAVARLVEATCVENRVQRVIGANLQLFASPGHYNLHGIPLELHTPDVRALVVIDDISEVRALESQLLRAEKLSTVGVLAAGIAHEVGTPLGIMRGNAEYALRKLGSDHAQASRMTTIIEEIDQVKRTIQTLLDFSRVQPTALEPVDCAAVAKDVAELLRLEAARRKIKIELQIAPGLPEIAADAHQLKQVLVNLAFNSLDACAPGGCIEIRVTTEGDADGATRHRVLLQVADDGCGIAPENLNRVFDPFFTTKKRGQGTGLGLAVVSQIARSHGAQVEIESEPGHGTRVSLWWPISDDAGLVRAGELSRRRQEQSDGV